MVREVSTRWSDPPSFRRAAGFVVGVLIVAAVVAAVALGWAASRAQCADADTVACDTPARLAVGLVPGIVLLLGGIGAFVITVRQWRGGRPWPVWQGAGWFLFAVMVVYLAIAGGIG
ncbi:hypothetical protein [Nocardia veterana]|uniref:Integral membrane protein n=1 Tax=Nocardia veterana TaxID=132249 RepID=A0A7X6M053_9NOCA|nr:hypothetical protein [Nocardia veterana]NKY87361.1 hypothetical protein [Nocardia veterana]